MMKPSIPAETVDGIQHIEIRKKLKKFFGHLNPANPPEVCPIRDVFAPVSDKWSILIFIHLGIFGVLRFNELKRNIHGVSAKILTERLKFLEQDGYLQRHMYTEVPIRVEYELTDFGYEFLDRFIGLAEWIIVSMPDIVKRRYQADILVNI